MRVILGTTKDTHRDHAVHARPLTDAKQSENGTGQCVLQCCRTSPQPTPRSRERHKEMQTGVGKVLDGSLRGLSTASISQLTESSSKPRSGKGTQTDSGTSETLLPENLGRQCGEWSASKAGIENSKARSHTHSVHWWLSHQSCQARYDHQSTTHEDSAVEVEAVTYTLSWIAS